MKRICKNSSKEQTYGIMGNKEGEEVPAKVHIIYSTKQ
jgi:hypothetical protein